MSEERPISLPNEGKKEYNLNSFRETEKWLFNKDKRYF